ncbi:hypothetical protein C0991_009262 [Blastosporella zonata]|nr:hypothetical protein C0991_009262 [Blastosporella zonata]
MFASTSLAEISRNTSVISSSSSSSSTSDLNDPRPLPQRPQRVFAAPRSNSDTVHSVRQLPSYIQRELGVHQSTTPILPQVENNRPRFNSPQDFEFGEILGHGSYSTVIQAQGRKSGRTYAIKVLDKAHLQRHNQRRTAYAEKEALVVLGTKHPGIVGLHSTFSDAWSLYFVLDLLPNGDLRALMARYGSLSVQCTRYYGAQLTDALDYIHSKGVMHRDIKPENLLLDARFRLALADFGTAKVLTPASPSDENNPSSLKRSNSFVGTPQYYSPELLAHSHTTPASDLWALGCVMYELHTGSFAFNAPSPLLTWRLIKALEYTLPEGFDDALADLVRKLLVAEPEERLGAGKEGMPALKQHPFFESVEWGSIWEESHPTLESGLKAPSEPLGDGLEDAELSRQLREERRMDEDEDDEMGWDREERIRAYLPGLRLSTNGNGGTNGEAGEEEKGAVQFIPGSEGEYVFPRVEGVVEGELPYDKVDLRVDAPTAIVEAALEQPVNVDLVEDTAPTATANASMLGLGIIPPVPVSTPLEIPSNDLDLEIGTASPPGSVTPPTPLQREFLHLLQENETLLLCTPLVPESSAPGGLVRLLPRLLSGSLRGKKPKLKERALILTNRRVLCVSTGKSVPTVKTEYVLMLGVAVSGKGGVVVVRGVETRGEDGVNLLTNEKAVPYVFDEAGAQEKWVQGIRDAFVVGADGHRNS